MLRSIPRSALAAAVALLGCAGHDAQLRAEVDVLRAEVGALRQENDVLSRRVDTLQGRVEVLSSRTRAADASPAASSPEPLVPPTLAVVRVAPPAGRATPSFDRPRTSGSAAAAPPLPIDIPIAEPDPSTLDRVAPSTGRALSTDAARELRAARGRAGLDRAHALEDFAARYPRHPEADNALADAAGAYDDAGRAEAACALARRVTDDYPAGDAMADGLERLAACEARRAGPEAERRVLDRLVTEHPGTPAARRAAERLSQLTGRAAGTPDGRDSAP